MLSPEPVSKVMSMSKPIVSQKLARSWKEPSKSPVHCGSRLSCVSTYELMNGEAVSTSFAVPVVCDTVTAAQSPGTGPDCCDTCAVGSRWVA